METKHYIGEKLSLRRGGNVGYYVGICRDPYTIIDIKPNGNLVIQECELIFNGPRYYNTLPDEIRENPNGSTKTLYLSRSKKFSGKYVDSSGDYPLVADFGYWEYIPYMD